MIRVYNDLICITFAETDAAIMGIKLPIEVEFDHIRFRILHLPLLESNTQLRVTKTHVLNEFIP